MAEIVTEDFRKSLRSTPTGKRKNGTIFDELYCSMESSQNPLDKAIQLIAEFHGPWSGGSVPLTDFASLVAARTGSALLKASAVKTAFGALNAQNAVANLVQSSVSKFNPQTCAIMPTPLLREFINRAQKLHPSINMYLQMHIGTFPYFQQISEDIGQFASIVLNATSVDPLKWPNSGGVDCLDTNSRMDKNTALKLDPEIFQLMDNALNLANSLFLRSMPKDNNQSFMHPSYSTEGPIAHGHNFTMDVFNADRNKSAVGPCMAAVLNLAQDSIRMVNKFFTIQEKARYEVEGYNISMNEGPNGEPVTFIVDMNNRPMYDTDKSNEITDPTNDKVTGTKKEYTNESD